MPNNLITQSIFANLETDKQNRDKGTPPIVRWENVLPLIQSGELDVNARHDIYGTSLLHMAARSGNFDLVAMLLNKGANPNIPANDGNTALHAAAWNLDQRMVSALLAAGAVSVPNVQQYTPLKDMNEIRSNCLQALSNPHVPNGQKAQAQQQMQIAHTIQAMVVDSITKQFVNQMGGKYNYINGHPEPRIEYVAPFNGQYQRFSMSVEQWADYLKQNRYLHNDVDVSCFNATTLASISTNVISPQFAARYPQQPSEQQPFMGQSAQQFNQGTNARAERFGFSPPQEVPVPHIRPERAERFGFPPQVMPAPQQVQGGLGSWRNTTSQQPEAVQAAGKWNDYRGKNGIELGKLYRPNHLLKELSQQYPDGPFTISAQELDKRNPGMNVTNIHGTKSITIQTKDIQEMRESLNVYMDESKFPPAFYKALMEINAINPGNAKEGTNAFFLENVTSSLDEKITKPSQNGALQATALKELKQKALDNPQQYGFSNQEHVRDTFKKNAQELGYNLILVQETMLLAGNNYEIQSAEEAKRFKRVDIAGFDFQWDRPSIVNYFDTPSTLKQGPNGRPLLEDDIRSWTKRYLSVLQKEGVEVVSALPAGMGVYLDGLSDEAKPQVKRLYLTALLDELNQHDYGIKQFYYNPAAATRDLSEMLSKGGRYNFTISDERDASNRREIPSQNPSSQLQFIIHHKDANMVVNEAAKRSTKCAFINPGDPITALGKPGMFYETDKGFPTYAGEEHHASYTIEAVTAEPYLNKRYTNPQAIHGISQDGSIRSLAAKQGHSSPSPQQGKPLWDIMPDTLSLDKEHEVLHFRVGISRFPKNPQTDYVDWPKAQEIIEKKIRELVPKNTSVKLFKNHNPTIDVSIPLIQGAHDYKKLMDGLKEFGFIEPNALIPAWGNVQQAPYASQATAPQKTMSNEESMRKLIRDLEKAVGGQDIQRGECREIVLSEPLRKLLGNGGTFVYGRGNSSGGFYVNNSQGKGFGINSAGEVWIDDKPMAQASPQRVQEFLANETQLINNLKAQPFVPAEVVIQSIQKGVENNGKLPFSLPVIREYLSAKGLSASKDSTARGVSGYLNILINNSGYECYVFSDSDNSEIFIRHRGSKQPPTPQEVAAFNNMLGVQQKAPLQQAQAPALTPIELFDRLATEAQALNKHQSVATPLTVQEMQNVDINAKHPRVGASLLHSALRAGNNKVAQYLLDQGASVHTQDRDGNTALHAAARNGNIGMAKQLIAHGAINSANKANQTPLDAASEYDKRHPGANTVAELNQAVMRGIAAQSQQQSHPQPQPVVSPKPSPTPEDRLKNAMYSIMGQIDRNKLNKGDRYYIEPSKTGVPLSPDLVALFGGATRLCYGRGATHDSFYIDNPDAPKGQKPGISIDLQNGAIRVNGKPAGQVTQEVAAFADKVALLQQTVNNDARNKGLCTLAANQQNNLPAGPSTTPQTPQAQQQKGGWLGGWWGGR